LNGITHGLRQTVFSYERDTQVHYIHHHTETAQTTIRSMSIIVIDVYAIVTQIHNSFSLHYTVQTISSL